MSTYVSIPFTVDSTGAIQSTMNDDQALQDRVMALVSTVPGDRLMRAAYGVPTPNALFDPMIQDMVFAELQMMCAAAIRKWEPAAAIVSITPAINQDTNSVSLNVLVGRADTPKAELNRTQLVYVTVGGDTFIGGN